MINLSIIRVSELCRCPFLHLNLLPEETRLEIQIIKILIYFCILPAWREGSVSQLQKPNFPSNDHLSIFVTLTSYTDEMEYIEEAERLWGLTCTRYRPGHIEIAGVILSQIIGFIIPATIYLLIDVFFPRFSHRHKIQSERRQPTWPQIWHCIQISMFNQFWLIGLHALATYWIGLDHTFLEMDPHLPTLKTLAIDFIFGMAAREVMFYYVHRALHHPSIYVYIHKMHHKYTAPISFAAEYAHPVEHIIANVLPIALPLTLKGTHFLSLMAFSVFELFQAAADHSGYDFFKLPPASIHDLHHEKFRVNYSTLGIMDWIHGTDIVGWDRPGRQDGRKLQKNGGKED